jgi:hypothetical protein
MNNNVTAMLAQSKLPMHFWGHCLAAQVKVWNCLPTSSLPGKTPYEPWNGQNPDLSHFRVFGCQAYVFVQQDEREKLESHLQKHVFVGYPTEYKAWLFYNPETKKFIISEQAEFDERVFPGLSTSPSPVHIPSSSPTPPSIPSFPIPDPDDIIHSHPNLPCAQARPVTPPPAAPACLDDPPPSPPPPAPAAPATPPLALKRPRRDIRPPGEWWKVKTPTPEPEPAPEGQENQEDLWQLRDPTPHLSDSDEEDG